MQWPRPRCVCLQVQTSSAAPVSTVTSGLQLEAGGVCTRRRLQQREPAHGTCTEAVLHGEGFALVEGAFTDEQCNRLLAIADSRDRSKAVKLFKGHYPNGDPIPDDHRLQMDLNQEELDLFMPTATRVVQEAVGADYKIYKPVQITSIAGGVDQPAHKDYNPEESEGWGRAPPVAMIVALQARSKLLLKRGSVHDTNLYSISELEVVEIPGPKAVFSFFMAC